jgi:splicing factor 3B subunit 2
VCNPQEFEVKMSDKKPGVLSEELKVALGMPEGYPPPWLINMQRFGPPPAYPNLRISGTCPCSSLR